MTKEQNMNNNEVNLNALDKLPVQIYKFETGVMTLYIEPDLKVLELNDINQLAFLHIIYKGIGESAEKIIFSAKYTQLESDIDYILSTLDSLKFSSLQPII